MSYMDLTDRDDPIADAPDAMERDHTRPLDLLADRLTVATLFEVGPEIHLLYLRSHHIVQDCPGAAGVFRRTAELYTSATDSPARRESAHAPLTIAELLEEERAYTGSARARVVGAVRSALPTRGHAARSRREPHRTRRFRTGGECAPDHRDAVRGHARGAALVNRLNALAIPATVVYRSGTHAWPYWQEDPHNSWPLFAAALGV
ncbi:hypothetical protein ABIA39_008241 [Nocardia sp. GAS34]|uniref:hypothetical protein n=1 Tax=unclassified Nocardia TaxID=2637762 RepID=UPI003D249C20